LHDGIFERHFFLPDQQVTDPNLAPRVASLEPEEPEFVTAAGFLSKLWLKHGCNSE
jgi:hypothetical protein